MHLDWFFCISGGFNLGLYARQVDETPRPDEFLKKATNMDIVEIWQVDTVTNISLRWCRKVFSCSNIFYSIDISAALV